MKKKIKTALVSVHDKENLDKVLKILKRFEIKIISSGGTHKQIRKMGYNCIELSKYTGFKEMLDGRVKTLHPKVHAGILHDRSNKRHLYEMKKSKFSPIDLIIVNFYPFQKIIKNTKAEKKIIENIDIGGPSMVRSAAKNFKNVLIITNKNDYGSLSKEIIKNNGFTTLEYREQMASKAFGLTAYYDSLISSWFNRKLKIQFPERVTIFGKKLKNLRYGENPHQKSAIYLNSFDDQDTKLKKIAGKELSYNNYNDLVTALEIVRSDKTLPTTAIIKHANPCGVSSNRSPIRSYKNALACDPISAYGGIISFNFKVSKVIAKEIVKNFYEVVIADSFDKHAIAILKSKKNLRLINSSKLKFDSNISIKFFEGNFMIQNKDNIVMNKEFKVVTKTKVNKSMLKEAKFAFNISRFVKSNAIIITKNLSTIGIGSGQPSRLDSCKIAIAKAKKFHKSKIRGSTAASDAFFPFPDGLECLTKAGIKNIIQPGGSKRDSKVISSADKAKVSMILTGIRHFNH